MLASTMNRNAARRRRTMTCRFFKLCICLGAFFCLPPGGQAQTEDIQSSMLSAKTAARGKHTAAFIEYPPKQAESKKPKKESVHKSPDNVPFSNKDSRFHFGVFAAPMDVMNKSWVGGVEMGRRKSYLQLTLLANMNKRPYFWPMHPNYRYAYDTGISFQRGLSVMYRYHIKSLSVFSYYVGAELKGMATEYEPARNIWLKNTQTQALRKADLNERALTISPGMAMGLRAQVSVIGIDYSLHFLPSFFLYQAKGMHSDEEINDVAKQSHKSLYTGAFKTRFVNYLSVYLRF